MLKSIQNTAKILRNLKNIFVSKKGKLKKRFNLDD